MRTAEQRSPVTASCRWVTRNAPGGPRGVIHSNSWDQGKLQKAKSVRSWPWRMSRMSADGEGGNSKMLSYGAPGHWLLRTRKRVLKFHIAHIPGVTLSDCDVRVPLSGTNSWRVDCLGFLVATPPAGSSHCSPLPCPSHLLWLQWWVTCKFQPP